jgi:hypothetical protein
MMEMPIERSNAVSLKICRERFIFLSSERFALAGRRSTCPALFVAASSDFAEKSPEKQDRSRRSEQVSRGHKKSPEKQAWSASSTGLGTVL